MQRERARPKICEARGDSRTPRYILQDASGEQSEPRYIVWYKNITLFSLRADEASQRTKRHQGMWLLLYDSCSTFSLLLSPRSLPPTHKSPGLFTNIANISYKFSNNLKSFCEKRDAFDCAGIRAPVFWLPVDCSKLSSWIEQSTDNRKTQARIPAQSKASYFPQKDFQFFENYKCLPRFKSFKLSARTPVEKVSYLIPRLMSYEVDSDTSTLPS